MTKKDVKALCETDAQLQWWAMVLFAEIMELEDTNCFEDNEIVAEYTRTKIKEFPRLIVQRQLEKIKENKEKLKAERESIK